MERALDLQEFLSGRLATLLELEPAPERAALDLAGVSDMDACGCQLLAVFMENLRRLGISPAPCGATAEIEEKIAQLGYSALLSLRNESAAV